MPASMAAWMVASDSGSSAGPYTPLIPMHPRANGKTTGPVRPNLRGWMADAVVMAETSPCGMVSLRMRCDKVCERCDDTALGMPIGDGAYIGFIPMGYSSLVMQGRCLR